MKHKILNAGAIFILFGLAIILNAKDVMKREKK